LYKYYHHYINNNQQMTSQAAAVGKQFKAGLININ